MKDKFFISILTSETYAQYKYKFPWDSCNEFLQVLRWVFNADYKGMITCNEYIQITKVHKK